MKKWIIRVTVGTALLALSLGVLLLLALNTVVHRGIITLAPQMTDTPVELAGIKLSPWSGKGEIKGFVVGNPKGYSSPSAIQVEHATWALQPASLLAEKLVIHSVLVEAPEITLEGGWKRNNLSQLLENLRRQAKGSSVGTGPVGTRGAKGTERAPRRLQVDEFIIRGATLRYALPGLGGAGFSWRLPPIELRDLGRDTNGITMQELFQRVLEALNHHVEQGTEETALQDGA